MYKKSTSNPELTRLAMEYLQAQGASAVGVVTNETLEGGLPSTDRSEPGLAIASRN